MSKVNSISKKKYISAVSSEKAKKHNPLVRLITTFASVAFVIYCISSFIITQAEIAQRKHELVTLQEKSCQLEAQNEEYESLLSEDDEREYMERIAIDTLGYAYPNERRFYDTTRS